MKLIPLQQVLGTHLSINEFISNSRLKQIFVSLSQIVKIQAKFCIQTYSKIIIHDLFHFLFSFNVYRPSIKLDCFALLYLLNIVFSIFLGEKSSLKIKNNYLPIQRICLNHFLFQEVILPLEVPLFSMLGR